MAVIILLGIKQYSISFVHLIQTFISRYISNLLCFKDYMRHSVKKINKVQFMTTSFSWSVKEFQRLTALTISTEVIRHSVRRTGMGRF